VRYKGLGVGTVPTPLSMVKGVIGSLYIGIGMGSDGTR
jgi:hypothetical protein